MNDWQIMGMADRARDAELDRYFERRSCSGGCCECEDEECDARDEPFNGMDEWDYGDGEVCRIKEEGE